MPLSIYAAGKCSSGYCKMHTDNDEQALLYCASFDRSQMDSPCRLRKGSASTQSTQPLQRYTTLEKGSHRHFLPSWSCQKDRRGKRRASDYFGENIKHHDPDMSLPFDSILSTSSSWFNNIKEKGFGTRQETLSRKYDYQEDILNDSSSHIKICLVRDKSLSSSSKEPRKYFAVKIFVRPRQNSLKPYLRRVTAEFCIAHTLQHPNVVRVFELLPNDDGNLCQVMEFSDAGSLLNVLERATKLEADEADCFFKQLLHGVQYIHSVGVSHRNLKPENLLLTRQGVLKLTDFSYAECFKLCLSSSKTTDDLGITTQHQDLKGTIPFIAPEQFAKTRFDPAAGDMWAVGIIYFAMRSGRLPWRSATYEDSLYRNYMHDLESGKCNKYIDAVSGGSRQTVLYSILQPNAQSRLTATQTLGTDWIRGIKLCAAAGSDAS